MENQGIVTLYCHTSVRHYGGRQIKTTAHKVAAMKLNSGDVGFGFVKVILLEDGGGHKRGHEISVLEKDFILLETVV